MKYLVLDIGGSAMKCAVMNEEAEIQKHGKAPLDHESLDGFVESVKTGGLSFCDDFDGVAVSMPGRIDTATGFAYTGGAFRFIQNIEMGKLLTEAFQKPVVIANDGKCAAQAEAWQGSLQDVNNGCVIVLGTGIGGGIVLNHKVWFGSHGSAGELSMLPSDFRDMWKDASDFMKLMDSVWAGSAASSALMRDYAVRKELDPKTVDGFAFFDAYQAGDETAVSTLQDFAKSVAAGIYAVQSVLDLDRYAIGGGISQQPVVTESIRKAVDDLWAATVYTPVIKPEIVTCKFHNDANLIGALSFYLQNVK